MVDTKIVQAIVRRELRDSLRDWRIVIPVLLLTSLFPFLMNFMAHFMFDFLEQYGAELIGERLVPFGTIIVGFFPITFSLVIALETFVGEKERHSLEALLATPASDLELYLGKLISALVLPLIAAYVGIAVYMLFIGRSDLQGMNMMLLVQILVLTTLEGIIMVSGAVIVSSHTTSVRAANLLASFIIIPAALLVQAEAVFIFLATYEALWYIALGLVVVNIILIRAGMRTFNREEILRREMDTLNLKFIARKVQRFWLAPPDQVKKAARTDDPLPTWSLGRFYRSDLPQLLRLNRMPGGVSLLVFVAAFILGWVLSTWWPLPPEMLNIEQMGRNISREGLSEATQRLGVLPTFSATRILIHNLRATILSLIFGIFSFGSLSLFLIGAPISVVGFLAGQFSANGLSVMQFLAAFILPHGIIELPATILAGMFALRIGATLISPPHRFTVGEGMLLTVTDFFKIFILVVLPMLLVASVLEVYVTPEVVQWLY